VNPLNDRLRDMMAENIDNHRHSPFSALLTSWFFQNPTFWRVNYTKSGILCQEKQKQKKRRPYLFNYVANPFLCGDPVPAVGPVIRSVSAAAPFLAHNQAPLPLKRSDTPTSCFLTFQRTAI